MNNENELTAALATVEKCREIVGCPEGVDLQDHLRQLAAENVALKATSDDRRIFIMNGVQLGYIKVPTVETDPALETIRIAVSPQEKTPATDRIVAGIKADGVELFAAEQRGVAERLKKRGGDVVMSSIKFCLESAEEAEVFAQQLRDGGNGE